MSPEKYDQLNKWIKALCIANGIDEIAMLFESQGKTIISHYEINGRPSFFYTRVVKTLDSLIDASIENNADWFCKNCNTIGSADNLSIGAEGLEYVTRCPKCKSDKLEYL